VYVASSTNTTKDRPLFACALVQYFQLPTSPLSNEKCAAVQCGVDSPRRVALLCSVPDPWPLAGCTGNQRAPIIVPTCMTVLCVGDKHAPCYRLGCAGDAPCQSALRVSFHRFTEEPSRLAAGTGIWCVLLCDFRPGVTPTGQGRVGDVCVREDLHNTAIVALLLAVTTPPAGPEHRVHRVLYDHWQFDRYLRTPKCSVRARCSALDSLHPCASDHCARQCAR
jgi:hypothetical protein